MKTEDLIPRSGYLKTGVMIVSEDFKHGGKIVASGEDAKVEVRANKVSGKGTIEVHNQKSHTGWHLTWWGSITIGIIVTVVGGIILMLIN